MIPPFEGIKVKNFKITRDFVISKGKITMSKK